MIGSKEKETALYLQQMFMNKVFRVYTSPDVLGLNWAEPLEKCNCSRGRNCRWLRIRRIIQKQLLLPESVVEISKLGVAMGGAKESFFRSLQVWGI